MHLRRSFEKRALKLRSWLFDRDNLTLDEPTLAKKTLRQGVLSLADDRLREFCDFYRLTPDEAMAIPSIRDKAALEACFTQTGDDAGLMRNYRDARFFYTARMQLAYSRFPVAAKLAQYFNGRFRPAVRSRLKVLDYGCGVGDYGLSLAVFGYRITLCDIEGGNLDFARWRFEQRGLTHDVIAVSEDNLYPDLGAQDIILAGEVLEHVRQPLTVLERCYESLPAGGLLWLSGYPEHAREVGGDHLPEAAEQREACLGFLQQAFGPATTLHLPGCLYEKRD
ncbi:MAG: methyltransferase [Vampirovibrionales bacterium]|nr:methyltransferase [Vampirovibrionales bacterium]